MTSPRPQSKIVVSAAILSLVWAILPASLGSRELASAAGTAVAATAVAGPILKGEAEPVHMLFRPRDPHDPAWRFELARAGIEILQCAARDTWIVAAPPSFDPAGPLVSDIGSLARLAPEDRISPALRLEGPGRWALASDGRARLRVTFFPGIAREHARQALAEAGAEMVAPPGRHRTATVLLDPSRLAALAAREEVQWVIEAPPEPIPLNDGMRANVKADTLAKAPYFLHGGGIKVADWDTGDIDATHQDLAGRVTLVDHVGTSGHATHVAGTLGGDGSRSTAMGGTPYQWRGVAPEILFYSYSFYETPVEDHDSAINTYGVDISQNSWGFSISASQGTCNYYGDYVWEAPEYDDIVTGFYGRRIPVVFAGGNERDDGDCGIPARGGYACVAPPATAKNVIVVGAIHSDTDSMTVFSSWGPTDDGRIRPDLVAPGCQMGGDLAITSTEPGGSYGPRCGTSMAAPSVSGTIGLLLEQYRELVPGSSAPLPSSLKGMLIQSARDLGPTGPDYSFGWGALDAWRAVDLLRTQSVIEDSLADLGVREIAFTVPPGETALNVTLVWDDPPAVEGANPTLVNDLDLVLIDPFMGTHAPYVLDPALPAAPATTGVDSVNNVEQVGVASPAAGQWLCRVTGTSVPVGPQAFSVLGLDLRPPEAASGLALEAVGDSLVDLRWVNPEDLDFAGTLVVRAESEVAWSPATGVLYSLGQVVTPGVVVMHLDGEDHAVNPHRDGPFPPGTMAHYRAFAYDMHLNYGAGVGDSVLVGNPVPVVLDTSPAAFELAVATNASIAVNFGTALDTTTVDSTSLRVVGAVSGGHWGALSFTAGGREVHLGPAAPFAAGEVVTVVLTTDIRSAAGYPLAEAYLFTFVTEAAGTGQGEYVLLAELPAGAGPADAALVDLDRDGDADGLVAGQNDGTLTVLRNNTGALEVDSTYAVGAGAAYLGAGDLHGDGRPDVVAALVSGNALVVLTNVGGGIFAPDTSYALIGSPGGIVVADLNLDGLADVAVTLTTSWGVRVFLNDGDGRLVPSSFVPTAQDPHGVVAGDVDEDGDPDLVVASALGSRVQVFLNQGSGSFVSGWSQTVGGRPSEAVLADFDADGDLDLAVLRNLTRLMTVFRNDGTGNFGVLPSASYPLTGQPGKLAAGDVDSDDDLDLLVSIRSGASVGLFRNTGEGLFAPITTWPAGGEVAGLAAADLDSDGDLDLLVSVTGTGEAAAYLNINSTSSVGDERGEGSSPLALYGVRPNPFRPGQSVLSFSLDRRRPVLLTIYDVRGREVARLVDGRREAGLHEIRWDARDLAGNQVAPGVYFARLQTETSVISQKLILSP